MANHSVFIDPNTEEFYSRIADRAGLSLEQVLADALFKFAGDIAMRVFGEDTSDNPETYES